MGYWLGSLLSLVLLRNPKTIDFDFDLFLKKGYRHFLQMPGTSKVDVDRFRIEIRFRFLLEARKEESSEERSSGSLLRMRVQNGNEALPRARKQDWLPKVRRMTSDHFGQFNIYQTLLWFSRVCMEIIARHSQSEFLAMRKHSMVIG